MNLLEITAELIVELDRLKLDRDIPHVYNPLKYAGESHRVYLSKYGKSHKGVVFLGMNPGPWGMAQTGVPFGEVRAVRDWMGITGRVGKPAKMHPRRPVDGFDCVRREVSGSRLWGWAMERFQTPERFFSRFFVTNYCPLIFFDSDGKNLTPDRLTAVIRGDLFPVCEWAFLETVRYLRPEHVVGIGRFAADRAAESLENCGVKVGRILHPSPANPKANAGWSRIVEEELREMGIEVS